MPLHAYLRWKLSRACVQHDRRPLGVRSGVLSRRRRDRRHRMIAPLPDSEIERLLSEEFVGRLACSADGRPYVVPIAYAYHDGYIYSHTTEGLKVRMMRRNRNVCFEVDRVQDEFNWRSVVAWGTFEELRGE